MDLSRLYFCVKVRTSMEKRRSDDAEEAGMQCIRVVLHRERALGDEKLLSPRFPGVKQRVPGYSLLVSSRVLGPQNTREYKSATRTCDVLTKRGTREYPFFF